MNGKRIFQTVYLVTASPRLIKRIVKDIDSSKRISWLYLGKNYIKRQNVAHSIGNIGNLVDTSEELQKIAKECRKDYIDYIGLINVNKKSKWWWLTTVSEKKPLMSDIFLHFCYLSLAIEHINAQSEDLIIVTESSAVLESIKKNILDKPNTKINIYDYHISGSLIKISSVLKKGVIFSAYVVNNLLNLIQSRIFRRLIDKSGITTPPLNSALLYCWTDKRSFIDPTRYNNIYYGDLGLAAVKKGINPVYLIQALPTIRYSLMVRELLKRPNSYILLEEYVTVPDIIRSLFIGGKIRLTASEIPVWRDMTVSDIVLEELRKDRFNTRSKRSYLIYCAVKRLCKEFTFSSIVYPFENLVWEKMFCLGVQESDPHIFLTGYAHSSIIAMNTNYAISTSESGVIPLPDRIVVNGRKGKDILRSSGFSELEVIVAGAIRYLKSSEKSDEIPSIHENTNPTILVVLPGGVSDSIELVIRILEAFADDPGVRIELKPHPICPFSMIKHLAPPFPDYVSLCSSSMDRALRYTNLVIYTDSTASIEALSKGIPVLHIKYELIIDINPLEGYECIPSVSSPDMIRTKSLELIQKKDDLYDTYREIASQFFEPLHEDYVEIYLKSGYFNQYSYK